MKETQTSEVTLGLLLSEFIPLFHRHVMSTFHERGELNLTKSQNKALMIMEHRGTVISSELGSCLDMTKASLTSLLDSLEQAGLVSRRRDENDRRKYWLTLTPVGKQYTQDQKKIMEKHMAGKLAKLSPDEQQAFALHLGKLVGIMKTF